MIMPITETQIITSDLHVPCSLFYLAGGFLFFLALPSSTDITWAYLHNTECSFSGSYTFFPILNTLGLSQKKHDITYF